METENIIKNIYFAEVASIEKREDYLETDGPMLLVELPNEIERNANYSFIMKDRVLTLCLQEIKQRFTHMFVS